jgi:hypothetical protein
MQAAHDSEGSLITFIFNAKLYFQINHLRIQDNAFHILNYLFNDIISTHFI